MTQPAVLKTNDNLVLVCGKSASGKTASLMNIVDHPGVMYFNCEAGKKLPFRNQFNTFVITQPKQVLAGFKAAEANPKIHTLVIDSLTYLMDMYESDLVLTSSNGMQAWQDYAQYFKTLMQKAVANSTKNVVILAHTKSDLNETDQIMETFVPIKGSSKNNGVESYFTTVIGCKKMSLDDLEAYNTDRNELLVVTEEEEILGFKYVYQTKLTKNTVNERIRSPLAMWSREETYIDNDIQKVMNRLHEYY